MEQEQWQVTSDHLKERDRNRERKSYTLDGIG
jgi:hypothetical protein